MDFNVEQFFKSQQGNNIAFVLQWSPVALHATRKLAHKVDFLHNFQDNTRVNFRITRL